jgi:hypothetical protein
VAGLGVSPVDFAACRMAFARGYVPRFSHVINFRLEFAAKLGAIFRRPAKAAEQPGDITGATWRQQAKTWERPQIFNIPLHRIPSVQLYGLPDKRTDKQIND